MGKDLHESFRTGGEEVKVIVDVIKILKLQKISQTKPSEIYDRAMVSPIISGTTAMDNQNQNLTHPAPKIISIAQGKATPSSLK